MAKAKVTKKKTIKKKPVKKNSAAKQIGSVQADSKKTGSGKSGGERATAIAKAKPPSQKTNAASPRTKTTSATSVDGILKKFNKERVTLDSRLAVVCKKIEDHNKKIAAMNEQVVKLTETKLATGDALSQLDQKRDAEISQLLVKLGVKFTPPESDSDPAESSVSNSPFAVLLTDSLETKGSDMHEATGNPSADDGRSE